MRSSQNVPFIFIVFALVDCIIAHRGLLTINWSAEKDTQKNKINYTIYLINKRAWIIKIIVVLKKAKTTFENLWMMLAKGMVT